MCTFLLTLSSLYKYRIKNDSLLVNRVISGILIPTAKSLILILTLFQDYDDIDGAVGGAVDKIASGTYMFD